MKRLFAVLLVLVMLCGGALAECRCEVPVAVKMAMYSLSMKVDMEDSLIDSMGYIVMGGEIGCGDAKLVMMTALLEYYEDAVKVLSDEAFEAVVLWITRCECGCDGVVEDEPEVTPGPTATPAPTATPSKTKQPHTHSGGTHENGGTCTGCGKVYQQHTAGDWLSNSNSYHERFCTYPTCGVQIDWGGHHWDGKCYGTAASGLVKKYCTICHEYSWVRPGNGSTSTSSGCCDKCKNCCENCSCGCGKCGK